MRGWVTVNWITLLSTLVGASAALFGSVLAHTLRSRDERRRVMSADRRQSYVEYLVALDAAQARLRRLAEPDYHPDDLPTQARRVFGEAGVFEGREKLLIAASMSVVAPAEQALRLLGDLRDAVRDGVKLYTLPYHDAYHPYADALWRLRKSIRVDLGSPALTAADLERTSWDDRASCDFCQSQKVAIPAQAAS
jgi:hypothetical protein